MEYHYSIGFWGSVPITRIILKITLKNLSVLGESLPQNRQHRQIRYIYWVSNIWQIININVGQSFAPLCPQASLELDYRWTGEWVERQANIRVNTEHTWILWALHDWVTVPLQYISLSGPSQCVVESNVRLQLLHRKQPLCQPYGTDISHLYCTSVWQYHNPPQKKTVKFYGYFGQSTSINMTTVQE